MICSNLTCTGYTLRDTNVDITLGVTTDRLSNRVHQAVELKGIFTATKN